MFNELVVILKYLVFGCFFVGFDGCCYGVGMLVV